MQHFFPFDIPEFSKMYFLRERERATEEGDGAQTKPASHYIMYKQERTHRPNCITVWQQNVGGTSNMLQKRQHHRIFNSRHYPPFMLISKQLTVDHSGEFPIQRCEIQLCSQQLMRAFSKYANPWRGR